MGYQKYLYGITFFFLTFTVKAQEKLIVFKVSGDEIIYKNKEGFIGMVITKEGVLNLGDDSVIILVDNNGDLYRAENKGNYSIKQLISKKLPKDTESASKKYLKYVYERFMNISEKKKAIYGGVNRGIVLMSSPEEYAYTTTNKWTTFNWKNPGAKTFYVTIRNFKSKEVVEKFKIDGTHFSLKLNNEIYKEKCIYQWTVSTDEFADLNKQKFYTFKIINKDLLKRIEVEKDFGHQKIIDLIIETNQ